MRATIPLIAVAVFLLAGCLQAGDPVGADTAKEEPATAAREDWKPAGILTSRRFPGVRSGCSIWGDLIVSSKGRVYVAMGDHGGTTANCWVYEYDINNDVMKKVVDVNEVLGIDPKDRSQLGHGKIHTSVRESKDGKIYFATDIARGYEREMENFGHRNAYPGGSIFEYDPATGRTTNLGTPIPGEGYVEMEIDKERNLLHFISHPRGFFVVYDIDARKVVRRSTFSFGPRRDMFLDKDNNVYLSNHFGTFTKYNPRTDRMVDLAGKLPAPPGNGRGEHDSRSSHLGGSGTVWGVTFHGILYSYDPSTDTVTRLPSVFGDGSKRLYTPNIIASRDEKKLYYIAGAHGSYAEGENGPVLVEYDIATRKRTVLRRLADEKEIDGRELTCCYASDIGPDGRLYFAAHYIGFQHEEVKEPRLLIFEP